MCEDKAVVQSQVCTQRKVSWDVLLPGLVTDKKLEGLQGQVPASHLGIMIFHGMYPCKCSVIHLQVKLFLVGNTGNES